MTLKELKDNIEEEKKILRELTVLISQRELKAGRERELLSKTIISLTEVFSIINNSIPKLAENVSPVKRIGGEKEVKELVSIKYNLGGTEKHATINEADKKRFFEELSLSEFTLKRLRKSGKDNVVVSSDFKKPSSYAKVSNRFFSQFSNRLIEKGKFKNISSYLRKANMPFILNSYVSMIMFTSFIAGLFSIFLFVFLIFFSVGIDSPFIQVAEITLVGVMTDFLICIMIPVLTFMTMLIYPRLEAGSIGKKINQELPFVTMHMSAIAGSGIEPTQIFKIIALGKEYKYTKQEMKKVINQVNVYGYDLVSALKNSARSSSSAKLAELFNGMATAISTGGSLTDFLDKRTETLLFDYKLERERATKMAETFMDIYISVVIAAPMIMMLLLILLSVGPINIGLSLSQLTVIIISVVALINIVFMAVLHLKQPGD